MTIKIKYFTDKVQKLEKISKGNWIDLRASEDVEMKRGEFRLIPLGIAVELPRGYEAHVALTARRVRAVTAEMRISGLSQCMRCAIR